MERILWLEANVGGYGPVWENGETRAIEVLGVSTELADALRHWSRAYEQPGSVATDEDFEALGLELAQRLANELGCAVRYADADAEFRPEA